MKSRIFAYADEYGNNSFDFTSQGTHFIVVSVIINEFEKEKLEIGLEEIRKRYFQTGEIKSKKVADNDKRRILILRDISKLNFHIYALVVNKQELFSEGFKYKEPFYKYLSGLLYKELFKAYPDLKLYVDELGSNDFLRSFKKYVHKTHIRDLFSGSEFETNDSKGSIIIQLADFIAGTLGRCYDLSKNITQKDTFLKILESKFSTIDYFPRVLVKAQVSKDDTPDEFDFLISQYATNLAIDFIERTNPKNQEESDQVSCLNLFLLHQTAFGSSKYLSSKEIIKHLDIGRSKSINDQHFRSTVIGPLRDKGILIASNAKGDKKGYRLPTSITDLLKFLDHGNSIVLPILNRIKICRERVKLATNNNYDILDREEFGKLKSLLPGITE